MLYNVYATVLQVTNDRKGL